jgi:hypothetical protein
LIGNPEETTFKTTLHLKVIVIFGIRLMSKMEIVFNKVSCGSVMFVNGMLRTIFGPKREEVTGGQRKLHNEELRNLYPSTYIT